MPARLRSFLAKADNTFDQEWMRTQRAAATMRVCNHQEQILDRFRRRLECESHDSGPVGSPDFVCVDGMTSQTEGLVSC
jgi:hypothetical protein